MKITFRQMQNNRTPVEDGLDSLGPWLHRVISHVSLSQIPGVRPFIFLFSRRGTIDFASAFGSGGRDSLWRIMAADGMLPKLVRCIEVFYAKVKASGGDELSFEISRGVRQGCALPPTFFNYNIA